MEDKRNITKALKHNIREIVIVFASFTIMVLAAYIFIGDILENRLLGRVEEVIDTAETNVKVWFSKGEITLLNSYYVLTGMLDHGASRYEILNYLRTTTAWLTQREQGMIDIHGIYGYINGHFYDSIDLYPGDDFVPQRQPWYQTAVRSGTSIAYTAPYHDARTENTIISIVQNVIYKEDIIGILAVDVDSKMIGQAVAGLTRLFDGYGILLSQDMAIMAHPDSDVLGNQFQNLGGDFTKLAHDLRSGEIVFDREIEDRDGTTALVFFKKIFNGWYVGSIIPKTKFYGDRYTSALILMLLGGSLAASLCYVLLRLSMARLRSEEENKYKSNFLAKMSHEIRTPMNAITGMAELLLRETLPAKPHEYAQDIKQASANLISIINDILDFSKIEAGQIQITPAKYALASLIQDTINIIRMRLSEKPIRFITNIDSNIPSSLIGDEIRLRQILLNILSNAVKYTDRGQITLTLTAERHGSRQVLLRIEVADTGRGITPEDQEKLFGDFIQVDMKKNSGIEGTGLGLAITRSLCIAMGGGIRLKSEYGKGSIFEASIIQEIDSDLPFACVESPEKKNVLVFEHRKAYAQSLCWSLDNLKVPCKMVASVEDFYEAITAGKWNFILTDYGIYKIYKRIREILKETVSVSSGDEKPGLILTVALGSENPIPGVSFLSLPVYTLSLANILNGQATYTELLGSTRTDNFVRYVFPEARILVVDDMLTNLKVTEGLLTPYEARVDTCLSGLDSIELVKNHDYDVVFMDHMMPGMDGIEAVHAIRDLGGRHVSLPVIALTANAVSGTREMYIASRFNDFLAKPMDIARLDEVLIQWIPEEKRIKRTLQTDSPRVEVKAPVYPSLKGVDVERGIIMTGGTFTGYKKVLDVFCKDAAARIDFFRANPLDPESLPDFVTQFHSLKSASSSLGAADFSKEAAILEAKGGEGNLAYIREDIPGFIERLDALVYEILDWMFLLEKLGFVHPENKESEPFNSETLFPIFRKLLESLKTRNIANIDGIMDALTRRTLEAGTERAVQTVSDQILMADYDEAVNTIEALFHSVK
ncbi:MAG: response regulator [Spirochaetota bacterium]|nr:response regulator [Spirochaetota bacterium]